MTYPIKFTNLNKDTLLLDNLFAVDDYLEYAIKHNMNVKFTAITSTSSVECIYKFVKNGFKISFVEERQFAPDELEVDPKIIVDLQRS